MNPTYLGELELSEDTLAHYGIKGMKWRHRKVEKTQKKVGKRAQKKSKIRTMDRNDQRYYPKEGIDTNRDPRFVRQGSGISKTDQRYYPKPDLKAKVKRRKHGIKHK